MDANKPKLAISFSGGRSSAAMLWLCLEEYGETHDILITFVNTGCEDPRTLDFVDAVDRNFADGKVVWIEAEFHEDGVGPTAKVVDYATASRDGAPFRAAVKKHGVFCRTHPQCTSRLKEEPMISYRRAQGWGPGTYDTAIGIRIDEADRQSSKAKQKRFIYPLIKDRWTKYMVNLFMSQFEWDLKLPSDAWGNCVWCWKKSKRKLYTLAMEDPDTFDFPASLEKEYGHVNKGKSKQEQPRVFFRGRQSAEDVVRAANTTDFTPYSDVSYPWHVDMDIGGGCGDSCEAGADD